MSQSKHILFISSWYPHKNNPTHGIFNRYFAQAAALYNKVSVLHVSSVEQQTNEFECEKSTENGIVTVQVYYRKVSSKMPFISHWLKLRKRNRAYNYGYKSLIAEVGKPDLIHLNVVLPAGTSVLRLSHQYGLPYVVNENWSGYCSEDGNYKGFFETWLTRKIIANAKVIMPTSVFLKEAMLAHGLNGRYEVVPNVVDVHRFTPKQKETEGATRFVHISSLTDREKNVTGIIKAFSKALELNPRLKLEIVGDGEERPTLEKLAQSLDKNKRITFRGKLLGTELVETINASDCLVMFSHFETFCLVIIEAFACGKPVITSNAGAIKSYMQPELGITIDKGNEEQLTNALIEFAENKYKFDSAYIRNYAVMNYSYEKIGMKLEEIYSGVLEFKSK